MTQLASAVSASWRSDDVAIAGDHRCTYGHLTQRIARTRGWLVLQGVGAGDHVVVQLDKEPAFIELFLAAAGLGAVFVPMSARATPTERRTVARDCDAALVVTVPPGLDDVDGIDESEVDSATPAVVLYTSGTTARAKGAVLSHGNILATVRALHDAWGWRRSDVIVHALPLHHVHGLFVAQLGAMYAGATAIWHRAFDADRVLDDLSQATMFMGVPTLYHRMLRRLEERTADTSNMRLFTSGSAGLPARDHIEWRRATGHEIVERYGMTEVGIVLSNPLAGPRQPGRVGVPLPGVQAKVVDTEEHEVDRGAVGALRIWGPSVFSGYLNRPRATAQALTDGWMRTGDLATQHEDGTFSIVGRAKELVITGGFNVYPNEVEGVLLDHPAVLEAAVFGIDDADLGEVVAAAVVCSAPVGDALLIAHCRATLSGYKVPKQIHEVPNLPRNAMGKVQKHVLRAMHTPVAIRDASVDDGPWLALGNREMARETEGVELDPQTIGAGVLRALTDDVGARYLVAELGGEPVGQLMVTTEWSDWRNAPVWWIQSVYVWPAGRKRGIYRAMHDHVVKLASAAGAAGVRLYVDERNLTAQQVYVRVGMSGEHYRVFEQMFDGSGAHPPDAP